MNVHTPGGGVCTGRGEGGCSGSPHQVKEGGDVQLTPPYKRGPGIPSLGSLFLDIRLSVAGLLSNPFLPGADSTIIFSSSFYKLSTAWSFCNIFFFLSFERDGFLKKILFSI